MLLDAEDVEKKKVGDIRRKKRLHGETDAWLGRSAKRPLKRFVAVYSVTQRTAGECADGL